MKNMKDLLERSAFGVLSPIAEKIGVAPSRVRLYFMYLTFGTFGSPIIIYLFLAFWMNIKRYVKKGKNIVFE